MSNDSQLMQQAKEAIAKGEYAYAITLLRDVVAYSSDYWEAYMLLGACLGKVGRITEGVRALNQAVSLNRRSPQAHYNLGKVLYQAGELISSADHLEQALRLDPSYSKAGLLLKEVRAMLHPKPTGWITSAPPPPKLTSARRAAQPRGTERKRGPWGMVAVCCAIAICTGVCVPIVMNHNVQPAPSTRIAMTAAAQPESLAYHRTKGYRKHKKLDLPAKLGAGTHTNYSGLDMTGKSLAGQDLEGCNFTKCTLTDADLSGCDLERAKFTGGSLKHANLSQSHLASARFDDADLHGASTGDAADLSSADLQDASLRGADLRNVNLQNANLAGCNLTNCDLRGANLAGCDLSGAKLTRANLDNAILDSANVDGADLRQAENLRGAEMDGVKSTPDTQWPAGFAPSN